MRQPLAQANADSSPTQADFCNRAICSILPPVTRVMSGANLPLVGKMLEHRRHRTTVGYAHLADGHLVEAAEKVRRVIAEAMVADTILSE